MVITTTISIIIIITLLYFDLPWGPPDGRPSTHSIGVAGDAADSSDNNTQTNSNTNSNSNNDNDNNDNDNHTI